MTGKFIIVSSFSICCLAMLLGCGRQDGKKTFEFLKAERDIQTNCTAEIEKYPFPKPPSSPVITRQTLPRERRELLKEYLEEYGRFLSTAIETCRQREKVYSDTEAKISRLDSSGVEMDAVNLTTSREQYFGDILQLQIEFEAWAKLDQKKLHETEHPDLIAHLIVPILTMMTVNPTAGAMEGLKEVSSDIQHKSEQQKELQSHVARLQELVTALEHDHADVINKRSQLVTTYGAKYPHYQWNSLLPVTTEGKH